MDKIRNIKNRLSLSMDKLSPPRHYKSPEMQRKSCHLASSGSPCSEGNIPAMVSPVAPRRPKRDRSRSSMRSSRPSSLADSPSTVTDSGENSEFERTSFEDDLVSDSFNSSERKERISDSFNVNNLSFDNFHGFSSALSDNDPNSLVEEVMKEVNKISTITQSITKKLEEEKEVKNSPNSGLISAFPVSNSSSESTDVLVVRRNSIYDNIPVSTNSEDDLESHIPASTSLYSLSNHKMTSSDKPKVVNSSFKTISTSSTLNNTESLTSGYFSDSASDEVGSTEFHQNKKDRAKTVSPLPKIFQSSKKKSNPLNETTQFPILVKRETIPPKKESIYSRLIKSTKRDQSSSRVDVEPVYAKIKPKLKLETSFKPIDPSSTKETINDLLVKPEPIYSKLKPKTPSCPSSSGVKVATTISSGDNSSSFVPISPTKDVTPLYSSVKPKKERSRTLPLESLYSKLRKKESSNTLPRNISTSSTKPKDPIYTQPLPALPSEPPNVKRLSSTTLDVNNYGKVIIKAKEIAPSKPSVITINNPGYAKAESKCTTNSANAAPLTISPPLSPVITSYQGTSFRPIETQSCNQNGESFVDSQSSIDFSSNDNLELSRSSLVRSESTMLDDESNANLNRLVEELAQELETASLKAESNDRGGGIALKRETLTRLLSTYDVPKNLRRVEEADENDIKSAENTLLPFSVSADELRFMDEDDNMETVYADVPDYSQDEFVIALDDENDPKYATLTNQMRKKARGGESPGKVSRKSAQVYVNVVNVISALKVLINSNSNKAATVINRMGTLAKPYASKVQHSISDNTWIQKKVLRKSGHNGFDELRRYIKSGGEFCKEVALILQERAELEATYAKGLHKLSTKLVKSSREAIGTVSEAWQAVGEELEHEGDVHRIFSASLTEEVVKPLKQMIESQHKIRKGVETMVDKTSKNLHDWRAAENKAKKNGYHNCRENEKVQDLMIEARLGRGKTLSEKEMQKLEKQRKKAEESVVKSDLEYYSYCIRTERARQEWELAIYKGSNCFQTLEEDRLAALKDLVLKYHKHNKETAPKLVSCAARLDSPVSACDVVKDIQTIIAAKGTGENFPEQTLPDFYPEDFNNTMNKARRRESLEKYLKLIRMDLDRERRGKQGVENLAKALQETPNFGGEDSQQDVNDKLQNMKAMLAYLEATRYKVQSSLDELNNRPKTSHPLAKHIEVTRDKGGVPISILKVPPWVRGNSTDVSPISESPESSPNWNDRGTADGNSVQPDSDFDKVNLTDTNIKASATPCLVSADNCEISEFPRSSALDDPMSAKPAISLTPITSTACTAITQYSGCAFMSPFRYPLLPYPTDEFSSQGSDPDYQSAVNEYAIRYQNGEDRLDSGTSTASPPDGTYYARPLTVNPSGRCKALYDYQANMYDELSIRAGDIINIHDKQPDGWWVGELDGVQGIFPATYVEEID